jgi:hypothetical protein
MTRIETVWVCDFGLTLPVAEALRHGLVGIATTRQAEEGIKGKMELLYAHLSGHEFRQHVESIVETFVSLQSDLAAERRAMEKIWARREKQIGNVIQNTVRLYGGVQGIIGQSVLPEIKALSLDQEEETPTLRLA